MKTNRREFLQASLGVLASGPHLAAGLALDANQCAIVIGPKAHKLEQKAALELQHFFILLFGFCPAVVVSAETPAAALILLGSPQSNPAIREAAGEKWPALTDQGFLLRKVSLKNKPALVIIGGTPIATLWGAYDFLESYGVRYLFRGDFIPAQRQPFMLPALDVVKEPTLRFRCWRIWNAHACGPESWGIQEQRRIIDQLVKQKVNAVLVNLWATQPFVQYEFRGVKKTSGELFWGWKYPIDCTTVGKSKFDGASEFVNPDFRDAKTYDERLAAGQELMHGILSYAHDYDLKTIVAFGLIDVPQEFKNHFNEWLPSGMVRAKSAKTFFYEEGIYTTGVSPEGEAFLNVDNPVLIDLAEVVLKAHIDTYPEADYYEFGPTEWRSPVGSYRSCWDALNTKYGIEKIEPLDTILEKVKHRDFYEPGRAERELKSDIQFLYFVDELLNDRKVLEKTSRPDAKLIIESITEELDPVLPVLLPKGSGYVSFIDYTMSRVAKRTEQLASLKGLWTLQTMTLQDDNASMLSQMVGHSMESVLRALNQYGIRGYYVRFWMPDEIDPAAYILSRGSWEKNLSAVQAYRDLLIPMCGKAIAEDVIAAFGEIEQATAWGDSNGMVSAGFPGSNTLMQYYVAQEPAPQKLAGSVQRYNNALPILLRARDAAVGQGHQFINYYVGRLQTTINFLQTCQKAGQLGVAYKEFGALRNNKEVEAACVKRDEVLKLASELKVSARLAVEGLADIAHDQSDRGMLAIMNRYVYQYACALDLQLDLELGEWHI